MKTFITAAGLTLALIAAGTVSTADEFHPIPAPVGTPFAMPPVEHQVYEVPVQDVYCDSCTEPLFRNVRYVDKREMHPCAVPKIIRVNDPCDCGTSCCGRKCVYIEICVPPCGCETVRCRRDGDRVRYDYGKYAVDVRVKKGRIVVDYQK